MNQRLAEAIKNNNVVGVQGLLLDIFENRRVNPAAADNRAIRMAVTLGHVEIVRALLADPRVDPGALNNEAIRTAVRLADYEGYSKDIQANYREIAKLLAVDPRVDPAVNDNIVIRTALGNNDVELVRFLFAIPKVASALIDGYLTTLETVQLMDAIEQLALMTGAESKDPIDLLAWAAAIGSLNLVKYLVEYQKVDPITDNNLAIRTANYYGRTEIVRYLGRVPGVYIPISSDIAYITIEQYFESLTIASQFDQMVRSALEVAIHDPFAHYMEYDQSFEGEGKSIAVGVLTNIIIHQTDQRIRNPAADAKSVDFYRNYYKDLATTQLYKDLLSNYSAAVVAVRQTYPPQTEMLSALVYYIRLQFRP